MLEAGGGGGGAGGGGVGVGLGELLLLHAAASAKMTMPASTRIALIGTPSCHPTDRCALTGQIHKTIVIVNRMRCDKNHRHYLSQLDNIE